MKISYHPHVWEKSVYTEYWQGTDWFVEIGSQITLCSFLVGCQLCLCVFLLQVRAFYTQVLNEEERQRLCQNMAGALKGAQAFIQKRMVSPHHLISDPLSLRHLTVFHTVLLLEKSVLE